MKHKAMISMIAMLGGLTGITVPLHLQAATRYVETWGNDAGTSCPRKVPCQTIAYAISQSGPNDRIIVGPGYYPGNLSISLSKAKLKLQSTAGRYGTTIQAGLNQDGLTIDAPGVQVGKKGKGFTFQGPPIGLGAFPITSGNGVVTLESRPRLEGNRFRWNATGLDMASGDQALVRNNIATFNSGYGIFCNTCERGIYQENRVEYNAAGGIFIDSHSDRVLLRRNFVSMNGGNGIQTHNNAEFIKVQDNVVENNTATGIDLADVGGSTVQGNIAMQNSNSGMDLDQDDFSASARVRHNLVLENVPDGIVFSDPDRARIENNMTPGNVVNGMRLSGTTNFGLPTLRNNSSYGQNCGLNNMLVSPGLSYQGQFFAMNLSETCGGVTTGSKRDRPASLNINRARSLVGG